MFREKSRVPLRHSSEATTGDSVTTPTVDDLVESGSEYRAGFVTDVESETLPPGLDESVVRYISARKG